MPLVTYDEQVAHLKLPSGTDKQLLEDLLAQTTALFEKESGRSTAPFAGPLTARTEIHEGGRFSSVVTLDYPISTITSIVTGTDVAVPDETLGASQYRWVVGERDIYRLDGYWKSYWPRWVKVIYNTLADYPLDVKIAIKRRVSELYQSAGMEGFSNITRGSRSWSVAANNGNVDSYWTQAVNNHRRAWVR